MKVAILGDLHWGIRGGHPVFFYHYSKVFKTIISYLNDNNIKTLFQLGDCFDNRKHIPIRALKEAQHTLFDPLEYHNIDTHILIGNHDTHFRSNIEINSPELLLREYSNIQIYSQPKTIEIDNCTIDMIPWICEGNMEQVLGYIDNSSSDLCLGHFEMPQFEMYKGLMSREGLDHTLLAKYELVISGHFHTRSQKDNIVYAGTNCQMTWQDHGDIKGFHVFDTTTRILEFIPIHHEVFVKIEYNNGVTIDINSIDISHKFIKVICVDKGNLYKFEQFLKQIYSKGPYEVKIIEDLSINVTETDSNSNDIKIENTMDVVGHYIDQTPLTVDKDNLKDLMASLYKEALNWGI